MNSRKNNSNTLSAWFAADNYVVYLTLLIILVAGLSALVSLPRIEDPRITTRNAIITTTMPGASAEQIEAEVTKPLEDGIREIYEVKRIESTSRANVSIITIEMQDNITSDTNEAVFSKLRDKLSEVQKELPQNASKPILDDKRGAVAFTLINAVQWNGKTAPRLGLMNRVAEELADRLRNADGTEIVRLFGSPSEEITVTVNTAKLSQIGLTINQLSQLLSASDSKVVAGVMRTSNQDLQIEVLGEFDGVQRIQNIPIIVNNNRVVTLNDIAEVRRDWRLPETEIALVNGQRSIFVATRMLPDRQVQSWSAEARARVAEYQLTLDPRIQLLTTYDESSYTMDRLGNLAVNLLLGAIVVMAVVMVFMGWRSAIVVGSALPLSMGISLFSLSLFGQQLHQMTIFGLIVAIGLLIDNAIVITDEIRKHIRKGVDVFQAVNVSVRHLSTPLFASTFTTILGFMPVFLLPGNVGDFVSPIAISVVLALIASFAVSLLLIPALTIRFARPATKDRHWWQQGIRPVWLINAYREFLLRALQRPLTIMMVVTLFAFSGFIAATMLGNEFFPSADRDQFQIEVWMPADASINGTLSIAQKIDLQVREKPGVKNTTWLVGGSTPPVYYNAIQTQDQNPAYAQGIVYADDTETAVLLIARLQAELEQAFPVAQIVVSPFGQGPPIEAPIGFRITGPDIERLIEYGEQLRLVMNRVDGVTHTQATMTSGQPKLWFAADESRVRQAGLTLQEVAGQLNYLLEGIVGGSVLEDLERLPVRLRADQSTRSSLNKIESLSVNSAVTSQRGEWIPLQSLGEFELKPEMSSITRRNGERVNNVYGYIVPGQLPINIMRAIQAEIEAQGLVLPAPYRLEVAGDSEEQKRAVGQLLTYLPVLLTLMVTTIILSFRNLGLSMVVGMVALQSVGFGMLSLWLGQFNLGFNPLIGTAGLIGVAINGSIVVLAALRSHVRASSGELEQIVLVTMDSGRHIISTTLTTVGGFIPLLVFSSGQFWPPLAIVIAGGVGFSIILSLLFTPCAFAFLARLNSKQHTSLNPAITEGGVA